MQNRSQGWTVRQVIHHLADSHMNSFIRFKLALTEEKPTIKPYLEDEWANAADYKLPINASLQLLTGLHTRWSTLLSSLNENDLKRTYYHPDKEQPLTIEETIGIYAWHCNHHLAHISSTK